MGRESTFAGSHTPDADRCNGTIKFVGYSIGCRIWKHKYGRTIAGTCNDDGKHKKKTLVQHRCHCLQIRSVQLTSAINRQCGRRNKSSALKSCIKERMPNTAKTKLKQTETQTNTARCLRNTSSGEKLMNKQSASATEDKRGLCGEAVRNTILWQ